MKSRMVFLAYLLLLAPFEQLQAQIHFVQRIVDAVDVDSLVATVRVLSGEVGSTHDGTADTIYTRWHTVPTHQLAIDYLYGRLRTVGLPADTVSYISLRNHEPGTNVLAEQKGTLFPARKYIICAHLDGLPATSSPLDPSPAADDNASGCAAVLEAARLLAPHTPATTIVYAFWDQEQSENGGSLYYATKARANGDSILGVLNLDMLGYDADNDSVMSVNVDTQKSSLQLAGMVEEAIQIFGIGLRARSGSIGASDNSSFWELNYGAVLLSEHFFTDYYDHGISHDSLAYFNLSYFQRMAKAAVGSLALLAGIPETQSVEPSPLSPRALCLEQNYPNPFNPTTTIRYALPERSHVSLTVYNTLGQAVVTLVNENQETGFHDVRFDGTYLASGVYFYQLKAGEYVKARSLLFLK